MYLEIDEQQQAMLRDLIESRIRELHPTIRRSRVSSCTDSLKQDLKAFELLLERLSTAATGSVT